MLVCYYPLKEKDIQNLKIDDHTKSILLNHTRQISFTYENKTLHGSPIHAIVYASFPEKVKENLIDQFLLLGVDINIPSLDQLSPIMAAIEANEIKAFPLFPKKKCSINNQNPLSLESPSKLLHRSSCLYESRTILNELLKIGANPNSPFSNGQTPLMRAASKGHLNIVKILLTHPMTQPLMRTSSTFSNNSSALDCACVEEHLEVAEYLLNHGFPINGTDISGETALVKACRAGKSKSVQFLLERNAEINLEGNKLSVNKDGQIIPSTHKYPLSLLHIAAENRHSKVLEILLDRGMTPNTFEQYGFTPLHLAVKANNLTSVKMLIKKGADINQKSKNEIQISALHIASRFGNEPIAEFLLENNALPNDRQLDGSTPLLVACKYGYYKVAKLLLKYGASVEISNADGETGLGWACKNGSLQTLEALLSSDIDMNAHRESKCTLIEIATQYNQQKVVDFLKKQQEIIEAFRI